MDIHFKKDFMKQLPLPEDMIFLIAGYAQEVVPFKKELLDYELNEYEEFCYNLPCSGRLPYVLKSNNKFIYIEDFYTLDVFSVNKKKLLYIFRGSIYVTKKALKQEFKTFNNIKELTRLTKSRYNKPFTKLNYDELHVFMNWYIMHYD